MPKPKARPVARDQANAKGKAKAKQGEGSHLTINLRLTHRTAVDASRLHHIPMVIADSDEDGLNEDGEDIDPCQGKDGSVTVSDGENVSDKEQDDINTLDAQAVRARFKEEVCIGYSAPRRYLSYYVPRVLIGAWLTHPRIFLFPPVKTRKSTKLR